MTQLLERLLAHDDRIAVSSGAAARSYAHLVDDARRVASSLLPLESDDADEPRYAFLVTPGPGAVAALLGIWLAGGIAVPLATMHPVAEWTDTVTDADVAAIVTDGEYADRLAAVARARAVPLILVGDALAGPPAVALPAVEPSRRALILYTSGTTGTPKGVVSTHAGIAAQIEMLVTAWEWTAADRILHVLPLHHIHGMVNVLLCALWAGARCDFLERFDPRVVWERLRSGELTLFMAVPTIYHRLIQDWERAGEAERRARSAGASALRLMVSGSAALPVTTLEKWREITSQVLLERYGMTETGMILSNPYRGRRVAGHVGQPLPTAGVRRVDDAGAPAADAEPGEIEVRGPAVFREYWRRPDETAAAFRDGWFRTGDVAVVEDGSYRLLGRRSVDIIKTGGYKVSALEIEAVLRTHPAVTDCAVVGVPDEEWGERVAACVVAESLTLDELRDWCRDRLAVYKIPSRLHLAAELPRNALGKITKPAVKDLFC